MLIHDEIVCLLLPKDDVRQQKQKAERKAVPDPNATQGFLLPHLATMFLMTTRDIP
jgi:hypothetical protein